MTLADLAKGDRGRIETLEGAGVVAQRLLEMGLTPGAVVTIVRFAPLGDPIEVKVRGYALSLPPRGRAGRPRRPGVELT